jgi:hypothetical protein
MADGTKLRLGTFRGLPFVYDMAQRGRAVDAIAPDVSVQKTR